MNTFCKNPKSFKQNTIKIKNNQTTPISQTKPPLTHSQAQNPHKTLQENIKKLSKRSKTSAQKRQMTLQITPKKLFSKTFFLQFSWNLSAEIQKLTLHSIKTQK